jgi:eukaryotic-like serine/threonine-protein kinase
VSDNPNLKLAESRVGMLVRKWTLDRLIDVGGMAAVYAATHRNQNRVALKVLHPEFARIPEAKERFLREGYAANKVGHTGAVTVLDDDELEDGTPFIVMELLQGLSLEDRLQDKRLLSAAEVFYIADQVLDVLAAAHAQSIIHRDIKPANLFLTPEGVVKVLDFGLARLMDVAGLVRTQPGTVIGTAAFMSPEQARGKRELVDHRTDIFAVGAVMFYALTGRFIYDGKNPADMLIAAITTRARPLRSIVPGLPEPVAAVVDRALAFELDDRFADASSMQAELRRVYESVQNTPLPPVGRTAKWVSEWVTVERAAKGSDDIHVSLDEQASAYSIVVDGSDD